MTGLCDVMRLGSRAAGGNCCILIEMGEGQSVRPHSVTIIS